MTNDSEMSPELAAYLGNVCAIRRKSDGYWWECNGEHGAGWNDKRIRQAWTRRAAAKEIADHLAKEDVEIVELFPQPAASTDEYRSLDHAMEILRGCSHTYTGEQAQAVAKALKQWRDKWAAAVDCIHPDERATIADLRAYRERTEAALRDLCDAWTVASIDDTDLKNRGLWRAPGEVAK